MTEIPEDVYRAMKPAIETMKQRAEARRLEKEKNRQHFVLAHTLPQFEAYRARGAFPKNAKYVKNSMYLRGAKDATLHQLPEWWRGYRINDMQDIDYMIREGFFEVEEYPELELDG